MSTRARGAYSAGAVAVYTKLTLADADRIARAHELGAARGVIGVPAGSVNSNYLVDTDAGRRFVRIYEEQGADGVAYEWALLDHLADAGLPVPRRVPGTAPGELQVAGKPTAVFELVGGDEICQAGVTPAHARAVGGFLARAHDAGARFERRRPSRFGRAQVRARLATVEALDRPELRAATAELRATLDALDRDEDPGLPCGVIHGDLFRDNVRWRAPTAIEAALDWESAADGPLVFDLAVAILAWCYGDALEPALVGAMRDGYEALRPLDARERAGLHHALLGAAARFTVTRITDYHLRDGADQVKKDWRRFLDRLHAVQAMGRA